MCQTDTFGEAGDHLHVLGHPPLPERFVPQALIAGVSLPQTVTLLIYSATSRKSDTSFSVTHIAKLYQQIVSTAKLIL